MQRITTEDQRLASRSLHVLTRERADQFRRAYDAVHLQVDATGEIISIPKGAMEMLMQILEHMSEGQSVSIVPHHTDLSTQQAADMLNVSRPHLVKMLEQGKIPYRKVGSHRRVLLRDLVHYRNKTDAARAKAMLQLTEQAQDLGLGYE